MVDNINLEQYLEEMETSGYSIDKINKFYSASLAYVAKKYIPNKNALIVDLDTAIGHVPMVLKSAGYKNISCVDGTQYKEDFLRRQGFKFYKVNLEHESLPFPDQSVDAITCFEVIEHLNNPINMLSECYRVLRTEGNLICSTPDYRQVGAFFYEDPTHVRPFIKEGLLRTLRTVVFKSNEVKKWGGRMKIHFFPMIYNRFPQCFFLGTHLISVSKR